MSNLTTKIRSVVGKGSSSSGRGMSWLYVNGSLENGRGTYEENEQTINKLISNFETYELNGGQTYVCFVYNNKNEYLGSCKIDRWYCTESERMIVLDYTYLDKEDIIQSFSTNQYVHSFRQIV